MMTLGAYTSGAYTRGGQGVQYSTPATGATVNVNSSGAVNLIIDPTGSLLALTVAFPSSPLDGDKITITSSQVVTTLTMSNGTIGGALTSLAASTFASWIYHSIPNKWFRCG